MNMKSSWIKVLYKTTMAGALFRCYMVYWSTIPVLYGIGTILIDGQDYIKVLSSNVQNMLCR